MRKDFEEIITNLKNKIKNLEKRLSAIEKKVEVLDGCTNFKKPYSDMDTNYGHY